MISFGYKYENGVLVSVEKEVEIVKRIFHDYLAGKTPKEMAIQLQEEKVEYDKGVTQWNKNRIYRILENKKYIGEENYPIVLSQELFDRVHVAKCEKGFQKKPNTEWVIYFKPIVFCAECGGHMCRRSKLTIKEKWFCPSGCKCSEYIDDELLVSAMNSAVQKIKENPNLARQIPTEPTYQRTPEILRYTNEITRAIHSEQPSFNLCKKMIYECANLKFQSCTENTNLSYTENLLAMLKDNQTPLSEEKIRKLISKLIVHSDGKIEVYFINGSSIKEESQC